MATHLGHFIEASLSSVFIQSKGGVNRYFNLSSVQLKIYPISLGIPINSRLSLSNKE